MPGAYLDPGVDVNKTVLLIEHDALIVELLTSSLQAWGYQTVHAGSIGAASTHLQTLSPQVVLLDLNLPDGNGLDLLPILAQQAPSAPVLILSGQHEALPEAIELGASGFVTKPFRLSELKERLELLRLVHKG